MKKLPESELEIMLKIWKSDKPVCRFDLEEELQDTHWAPTTILTLLSRLEAKGVLQSMKKGKVKYYTPIFSESEYAARESKGLMERFFGNSLKRFVACMADQNHFSEEELEELRTFLEEQKDRQMEETDK